MYSIPETRKYKKGFSRIDSQLRGDRNKSTSFFYYALAPRGLEERRNSQQLLTKSFGPVHFS